MPPSFSWILDSGGAGRGAWQGGLLHEIMRWSRKQGCYPQTVMGASAGGYAAADVATGTESTVMKGWTNWGRESFSDVRGIPRDHLSFWGMSEFRLHLRGSIQYVMSQQEVAAVFSEGTDKRLLIFTTRLSRRDKRPVSAGDHLRYFFKSATRKMPQGFKYLPRIYREDPIIFVTPLPNTLGSEYVRPLTPQNYHAVIEASCLVPIAMGSPLSPAAVGGLADSERWDAEAVFLDGSFTLKIPLLRFAEDDRFSELERWARRDKTLVICCDPKGRLWDLVRLLT